MKFRHHPDRLIYLGTDCYPLSWFEQQEPGYSLQPGAIGREYIPGVCHVLYSSSAQWSGDFPWIEGDIYLSNVEHYRSTWQQSQSVEQTALENWTQFRAQVSLHSAYFRLVLAHPQNAVLNDLLVPLAWRIGAEPQLITEFAQLWNTMIDNVVLSSEEAEQLNAIATACNVPLALDPEGRMISLCSS